MALVESFARGEPAADWTNILSNPRADYRFYYRKIRGLARIGQTKNELDNADAAGQRFHQDQQILVGYCLVWGNCLTLFGPTFKV